MTHLGAKPVHFVIMQATPLVRNRKQLESLLQQVPSFSDPQQRWEQYVTPGQVAASWLYDVQMRWDCFTPKRAVLDLGCGPGALMIGCLALGAGYACGVDIDSGALTDCRSNLQEFFPADDDAASVSWDLLQADVTRLAAAASNRLNRLNQFDTVITNPPFGTFDASADRHRKGGRGGRVGGRSSSATSKGADLAFLEAGIALTNRLVFSLHKTVTLPHVMERARTACQRRLQSSTAVEGRDFSVTAVANLRYNLDRSYKHHRLDSKDIEVSVLEVAIL